METENTALGANGEQKIQKAEVELDDATKTKSKLGGASKKPRIGIVALIVGIVTLIIGVVVLVLTLNRQPAVQDAEYLVTVGSWQREDAPSVVWEFTEVGKGNLTTNAHANDYEFIWAIEDGKLKVETNWLYDLNDDYTYKIKDNKLILNDQIVFIPAVTTE